MQLSLFMTEIPQDEKKYFFITNGYCFDRIKYGKKTNERSEKMANLYENKIDIVRQLTHYGYSQNKAEELVNRAIADENNWYSYIEEIYIF